jgi:type I restriction enzyme S subunit
VDFDPVIDNALAAGNPIPEPLAQRAETRRQAIANGTANREAAQAFPASFCFTEELGWIPEGWEVKNWNEIATITKGKSYKSDELQDSKTALVTLKSFNRGGGYRLDGLKSYIGKFKPEQVVTSGDLVIAYTDVTQAADVIGKPALVIPDSRFETLVISLDVAVVKPVSDHLKYYLYGMARSKEFEERMLSFTSGTTVLHLAKNAIPEHSSAIPSEKLLNDYHNVADSNFQRIVGNIEESQTLAKLRDVLMPKLISGELRIPQAEKMVEEAIA